MNEIEKLRKEFNDRLDALEKKQNIDWVNKILTHLEDKISDDSLRFIKDFLDNCYSYDDINDIGIYYAKSVLTWIIQAVADILNKGKDVSRNWYEIYFNRAKSEFSSSFSNDLIIGMIKFHPDIIDEAKSILENLNRINILKMYFEVDNEK